MNAGRFKRIVESLAIDVPVLRAEALPGGGVRFFLYGGRIVDTAGDGEAEGEGGVEQPAPASSRGGQRRQPPGKGAAAAGRGAAAAGSRKAVPGEQSTGAGRQAAAPGRQR